MVNCSINYKQLNTIRSSGWIITTSEPMTWFQVSCAFHVVRCQATWMPIPPSSFTSSRWFAPVVSESNQIAWRSLFWTILHGSLINYWVMDIELLSNRCRGYGIAISNPWFIAILNWYMAILHECFMTSGCRMVNVNKLMTVGVISLAASTCLC